MLTAAFKSRPGITSGYADCPLTCYENTAGNADNAAARTDKPGGTAGNVELLEISYRATGYCNPNCVGGPAGTAACKSRSGIPDGHKLTALLLLQVALPKAPLSPRALLAMLTALLLALTVKPGGTAGNVELLESFTVTAAASCNPTALVAVLTAAFKSRPGISSGYADCPLTCYENTPRFKSTTD